MKSLLITIGNEILSGATLDTNSHFIAREFNKIGINTIQKITISDNNKSIKKALEKGFKDADLIITTGGLGPTKDDITKNAIAEFFEDTLIKHQESLDNINKIFKKLGRTINTLNENQALVPSKAKVIINDFGTAPCLWIEKNKKVLICLPGVPYETEELIQNKIIPLLKKTYKLPFIVSKLALIIGIPESILAEKLSNWEKNLPKSIELAYLPNGSRVKIKLTKTGEHLKKISTELEEELAKLKPILGDAIFSITGEKPEDKIVDFLKSNEKTVAVAESCTGGLLSYSFVSKPGSSSYYLGSITSYATVIKKNVLKISDDLIYKFSAVSSECAESMAKEISFLMDSDLGISTTGVAGPASDERNNKVGLAYIGVYYKGKSYSKELYFPHLNREEFMKRIAKNAIEFALEICLKKKN